VASRGVRVLGQSWGSESLRLASGDVSRVARRASHGYGHITHQNNTREKVLRHAAYKKKYKTQSGHSPLFPSLRIGSCARAHICIFLWVLPRAHFVGPAKGSLRGSCARAHIYIYIYIYIYISGSRRLPLRLGVGWQKRCWFCCSYCLIVIAKCQLKSRMFPGSLGPARELIFVGPAKGSRPSSNTCHVGRKGTGRR
jgi:hypothetical protein